MKALISLMFLAAALAICGCGDACNSTKTETGDTASTAAGKSADDSKPPNCLKTFDGEDSVNLTNYDMTFEEAGEKTARFARCFKTSSGQLSPSNLSISYQALLDLEATLKGSGNYLKALIIHFGLNGRNVEYVFQTALCSTQETAAQRTYTISKGKYYKYISNRFEETTDIRAIDRYQQQVAISRSGDGQTFEPFGSHGGTTVDDNARAILFPFQEMHALHNDNEAVYDVRNLHFFSVSRGDNQNGRADLFKHYIVMSPIPGQTLTGRFYRKSANLGSLCPVNCDQVSFRLQCQ